MDELQRQIGRARRRLVMQAFGRRFGWSLAGAMLVAAIGLAVTKFFVVPVDPNIWNAAWIGGAAAVALLVAGIWTYLRSTTALDAAVEIDRRFSLRERVSSALALTAADREAPFGQALVADAETRAARLDVSDQFKASVDRRALAPLSSMALAAALVFIPNKLPPEIVDARETPAAQRKQIEQSTNPLQKKLADKRQEAEKQKLKEAAELFTKVEAGVRELVKADTADRKQAVVKLNDLANEIKERRQKLADMNRLQQPLQDLKKISQGPADKLADALRKGQLQTAQKELEKLKEKLADPKADPKDQEKLAEQMKQMQEKLSAAADAQKQARESLEKQADQARQSGDQAKADELQRKLDQLNRQSADSEALKKLAESLKECAECMNKGDKGQSQQKLQDLSKQMQELAQQMRESDLLEQALDQLAEAKSSMTCDKCGGEGCEECQEGQGGGGKKPGNKLAKGGSSPGEEEDGGVSKDPGNSKGGRGGPASGYRPKNENDTKFYDSQVRSDPGKGKSVNIGEADGPNLRGKVTQSVASAAATAERREDDPQNNRRLPPAERDQAREYFELLRGGKDSGDKDKPSEPATP